MRVAHITEQGAILYARKQRIVVSKNRTVLTTLRTRQLDQICLWGRIRLSPSVIYLVLRRGIDTVFLGRNGEYRGRLIGPLSRNIELRHQQFVRLQDTQQRLAWARSVVRAKITNARTLLRHRQRHRRSSLLQETIHQLRRNLQAVDRAASPDELRGIEGEAAAAYFRALGSIIDDPFFRFERRTRRPPRNPANALLSFAYTLLLTRTLHAVQQVGLDPYLGCLHDMGFGKPALALDLMEPFRPALVDTFVWDLIVRRRMGPDDFETVDDDTDARPVRLSTSGLQKFLGLWEHRLHEKTTDPWEGRTWTWDDLIVQQARRFARAVREGTDWQPFVWYT